MTKQTFADKMKQAEAEERAIMTKLSKAQSNAIALLILDEYRAHRRDNDPQARNTQVHGSVTQATYKSLATKGLLVQRNGTFDMDFTDTGRKMAIDLLHEGAAAEMENAFKYRMMEDERIKAENRMQRRIIQDYNLNDWEVDVAASYRLRDMSLRYSIDLAQKRDERDGRLSDLVSIGWSHDEYTVDTTSTSLTAHSAKRMGELMLIAAQIIESSILNS